MRFSYVQKCLCQIHTRANGNSLHLFQGFHNPHGIAICPNGTTMYVTEIGPNKVWKFSLVSGDSV
jgi:sugar lactone lactonase YvrE